MSLADASPLESRLPQKRLLRSVWDLLLPFCEGWWASPIRNETPASCIDLAGDLEVEGCGGEASLYSRSALAFRFGPCACVNICFYCMAECLRAVLTGFLLSASVCLRIQISLKASRKILSCQLLQQWGISQEGQWGLLLGVEESSLSNSISLERHLKTFLEDKAVWEPSLTYFDQSKNTSWN